MIIFVATLHCLDEVPTFGIGMTADAAKEQAVSLMLGEVFEATIRRRLGEERTGTFFVVEQRHIPGWIATKSN